jgi:transcriptional regulator with XRE-family HTH domain
MIYLSKQNAQYYFLKHRLETNKSLLLLSNEIGVSKGTLLNLEKGKDINNNTLDKLNKYLTKINNESYENNVILFPSQQGRSVH